MVLWALSCRFCWCYQVQYDGSTIGAEESKILDHFFASEIKWACNSRDAAWLRRSRMHSLACRLADLLVFCRSSEYVCICIIMHIWPVFCTLLMFIFLYSMDWRGTCTLQPQSHRCRKWSLFHTKVGKLKIKPAIYLLVSLLLAVPGVFLTVEGLVTRSGLKPLQSLTFFDYIVNYCDILVAYARDVVLTLGT